MKVIFKHVIKLAIVFAMIMCWVLSIGYANELKIIDKSLNIYFQDNSYTVDTIYNMQSAVNEKEDSISFIGWSEKENVIVTNANFNRSEELNLLSVCGSTGLIVKGQILFADDTLGCLLDENSAYKLFGSTDVIGNKLILNEKEYTIRGIHQGVEDTMVIVADKDSKEIVNGITIDTNDASRTEIDEFINQYGFPTMSVNNNIYYYIANFFTALLPMIILMIVIITFIKEIFINRDKPILSIIYLSILAVFIFVFFKISNYSISIPLDILPNKWSDFDYWGQLIKEYMEKFKYLLYMKKYSMDIFYMSYMWKAIGFGIVSIILFFISKRFIKVNNSEQLLVWILISFAMVFVVLVRLYYKEYYGLNSIKIWIMIPYYCVFKFLVNKNNTFKVRSTF